MATSSGRTSYDSCPMLSRHWWWELGDVSSEFYQKPLVQANIVMAKLDPITPGLGHTAAWWCSCSQLSEVMCFSRASFLHMLQILPAASCLKVMCFRWAYFLHMLQILPAYAVWRLCVSVEHHSCICSTSCLHMLPNIDFAVNCGLIGKHFQN